MIGRARPVAGDALIVGALVRRTWPIPSERQRYGLQCKFAMYDVSDVQFHF